MCNTHNNLGFCCPEAQIFQEQICGNLQGPLTDTNVWLAPTPSDYFQGSFEVFNSGPGIILFEIQDLAGNTISGPVGVPVGTSIVLSVNNPGRLVVNVPDGTRGRFCINLYKRIFA
jgi:hypothetical protein